MKTIKFALAALAATFALSAAAADAVKKVDGVLVNSAGMTVYTFDKDVADSGKSACAGQCAAAWPAVMAGDTKIAAPYSVVTREDGAKQLAYKGKPLYTFAKDAKAGDRTGDKFKDVWHVVAD